MGYDDDLVKLRSDISYATWTVERASDATVSVATTAAVGDVTANDYRGELLTLLSRQYDKDTINQQADVARGFFRTNDYDRYDLGGLKYQESYWQVPNQGVLVVADWVSQPQQELLLRLNQEYSGVLFDRAGITGPGTLVGAVDGCSGIAVYGERLPHTTSGPMTVSIFAVLTDTATPPVTKYRQLLFTVAPDGTLADVTDRKAQMKYYLLAQLYLLQNRYSMKNMETEQVYRPQKLQAVRTAIRVVSENQLDSDAVKLSLQGMIDEINTWNFLPRASDFGLDSSARGIDNLLPNGIELIHEVIAGRLALQTNETVMNDYGSLGETASPRRRMRF